MRLAGIFFFHFQCKPLKNLRPSNSSCKIEAGILKSMIFGVIIGAPQSSARKRLTSTFKVLNKPLLYSPGSGVLEI